MKKRNWAVEVYPDSAPDDWIEKIRLTGVSFAVSPCHDKDINPNGTTKKGHYHVILCYPGPTTEKNVNDLLESINQNRYCEALESVVGYYRYFTHRDNPEKYQYNSEEIQCFNGFDAMEMLNSMEVRQRIKLIQGLILENDFKEYSDLMDYLLGTEEADLYDVASRHTLFFNSYLTSRRHCFEKSMKENSLKL